MYSTWLAARHDFMVYPEIQELKARVFAWLLVLFTACSPAAIPEVQITPSMEGLVVVETQAEEAPTATLTAVPTLTPSPTPVQPTVTHTEETPPGEILTPAPTNVRVEDDKEYFIPQMLGFDTIRPIYEPTFSEAEDSPLMEDELVMGIVIDGQAKAYPVSVLRFREMVDDELGGIPILVTW